jgi:hypothetical protein
MQKTKKRPCPFSEVAPPFQKSWIPAFILDQMQHHTKQSDKTEIIVILILYYIVCIHVSL